MQPVQHRSRRSPRSHLATLASRLVGGASVLVAFAALSACTTNDTPAVQLTPAGEAGHKVYLQSGCATCHGANGGGGAGPKLIGLFGTDVELNDGNTVTADADYLTRSISDPRSQQVKGYNVAMPTNHLTAEQVSQIVDYITEIGPKATTQPASATSTS